MDSTIQHRLLTGDALHEPKGCATATSGTAYLANGEGSGSWKSVITPDDQNYFAAVNYGTSSFQVWNTGYANLSSPITLIRSRGSKINGSNLGVITCERGYYEIYFWAQMSLTNDYNLDWRLNNVPNAGNWPLTTPVYFPSTTTISLQGRVNYPWNIPTTYCNVTNPTLIIKEI